MAKIKYDVKGVEGGAKPIPADLYMAKVAEVEETTSKRSGNPMLKVEIQIATGDFKGRKLWDYIVLDDSSAWKLRQFIDALGLKDSGTFDTKKVAGTLIQVRVKHETSDEYGVTARVGALLPTPDDMDEDDLTGDDDADDLETAMTTGDGGDDDGDDPDATAADDDEDDLTLEDLAEYDREDMEELVEEYELEVKFNKRTPDDKLRERIAEALDLEPEDDGDDADDDDDVADYDEWDVGELRTELKDRGLKSSGPKKVLVKRLTADDESDSDDAPF